MAKKKNMFDYNLKEDESTEENIFQLLSIKGNKEEKSIEVGENETPKKIVIDQFKKVEKKEKTFIAGEGGVGEKGYFGNKKKTELKTINIYLSESKRTRVKKAMIEYQQLTDAGIKYTDIFEAGLLEFEKYIKQLKKDEKHG